VRVLSIVVSDAAFDRLRRASLELGRTVEDLAEGVVEDAALRWETDRPSPLPGRVRPLDLGGATIGLVERPDGSIGVVP
jgi:hypothetical protein